MESGERVTFTGRGGAPLGGRFLPATGAEGRAPAVALIGAGGDDAAPAAACALAAAGFAVLLPDPFAPEADGGGDRRELAALDAACAWLAARDDVDPERVAVVGLGAAGTLAFLHGCHSDAAFAVASLGGPLARAELSAARPMQPLEMALNLSCPALLLVAAGDPGAGPEVVAHARQVLTQFARSFELEPLPPGGPAGARALVRLQRFLDAAAG